MATRAPAAVHDSPAAPAATLPAASPREQSVVVRWGWHIALLAVGAGLVAAYLWSLDTAAAVQALSQITEGALLLALGAYSIGWLLRAARLHLLARAAGVPITGRETLSTAFGANTLNLVAPARLGDVAAYLRIKARVGQAPVSAGALVIQWRLTDLAGLLLFGLTGAALLAVVAPDALPLPAPWLAAGAGLLAAGFLVGALLARRANAAPSAAPRVFAARAASRLLGRLDEGAAVFSHTIGRMSGPRPLAAAILLSALAWACDAVVATVILAALAPVGFPLLLVVVPLVAANVAKMIPSTPGGIGVFEAAFAAALLPFGIPLETGVVAAAGTHLAMNLYTLVAGAPGAWFTLQAAPRAFRRRSA